VFPKNFFLFWWREAKKMSSQRIRGSLPPCLKEWCPMHGFAPFISVIAFWVVVAVLCNSSWSHVPYLEKKDFTTTSPFLCPSAEQSIAVYSWLESSSDVDYYRVRITAPTVLYAGVIVPAFDQYAEFRPQFAVVGPGLPSTTESIPIETKPESGVLLRQDDGKKLRKKFYEPFGNKSYYKGPEVSTLLQVGDYTLVYWDVQGRKGDYVAIIGNREVWNGKDILHASAVTPMIRRGEELHTQQTKTFHKEREKTTLGNGATGAAGRGRLRNLLKTILNFKAAKEKER
jgi:hypothetical protein